MYIYLIISLILSKKNKKETSLTEANSKSIAGTTRKRSRDKSAEPTSIIDTTSDFSSLKKTSDSNTRVRKFIDLNLSDNNKGSELNTEDFDNHGEKSGDDDPSYDDDYDNRNNIDDDEIHYNLDDDYNAQTSKDTYSSDKTETYITKKEFNYTMELFDSKITSIYKLCKFIADTQKEGSKSLKKLVVLDELSENFWNVSI